MGEALRARELLVDEPVPGGEAKVYDLEAILAELGYST